MKKAAKESRRGRKGRLGKVIHSRFPSSRSIGRDGSQVTLIVTKTNRGSKNHTSYVTICWVWWTSLVLLWVERSFDCVSEGPFSETSALIHLLSLMTTHTVLNLVGNRYASVFFQQRKEQNTLCNYVLSSSKSSCMWSLVSPLFKR